MSAERERTMSVNFRSETERCEKSERTNKRWKNIVTVGGEKDCLTYVDINFLNRIF